MLDLCDKHNSVIKIDDPFEAPFSKEFITYKTSTVNNEHSRCACYWFIDGSEIKKEMSRNSKNHCSTDAHLKKRVELN